MVSSLSIFLTLSLSFVLSSSGAGKVSNLTWESEHASSPATLKGEGASLLPLIRLGVATVPESKVMKFTFVGGSILGLPDEKAKSLHKLVTRRYELIAKDPVFSKATSALPYCYSAARPTKGFLNAYLPENANAGSSVILFLHGYGGSFSYYLHYFAKAFPDHIIVCPAYGISCAEVPGAYLDEALGAVSKEVGFALKKPILIGLSAGGFGGFHEYCRRPSQYLGFISMAAPAPKKLWLRTPPAGRIRVIAGAEEGFVQGGELAQGEKLIRRRTRNYRSLLLPDKDHFFMLSAEKPTVQALRRWLTELSK